MRTLSLIAFAIMLCSLAGNALAQSSNSQPDSSSKISTSSSDVPDDQSFAQYQRVVRGIKPPKATSSPDPKFPPLPADAEQSGNVVMLIGVNPKGRVEAVRVLRSDEQTFEATAVETVKKWKFKPATKDGKPIPVQITVEMHFQK